MVMAKVLVGECCPGAADMVRPPKLWPTGERTFDSTADRASSPKIIVSCGTASVCVVMHTILARSVVYIGIFCGVTVAGVCVCVFVMRARLEHNELSYKRCFGSFCRLDSAGSNR